MPKNMGPNITPWKFNIEFAGPRKREPLPWETIMSHEKQTPGCLEYIGDEKLPSYVGIIVNHYKDPY